MKSYIILCSLLVSGSSRAMTESVMQDWLRAANDGKTETLAELYQTHQIDPNVLWQGKTALHVAAHNGRSDVIQYLLSIGADPRLYNAEGNLPLHCAIGTNQRESCRVLLQSAPDSFAIPGSLNCNAYTIAAIQGKLESMIAIEEHIAQQGIAWIDLFNQSTEHGYSCMHLAAFYGHTFIIDHLLDHEIPIDCVCKNNTPFAMTLMKGNISMLQHLLSRGAQPNQIIQNMHPLELTIKKNRSHIIPLLGRYGARPEAFKSIHPILLAAQLGNIEATRKLVEAFDIEILNFIGSQGQTILHDAAAFDQHEYLKFVLSEYGNAHISTIMPEHQSTPLIIASSRAGAKTIQILLDYGADPLFKSRYAITALHGAASHKSPEALKVIYDHLKDTHPHCLLTQAYFGVTPVHHAAEQGHYQNIQAIIEILSRHEDQLPAFLRVLIKGRYIASLRTSDLETPLHLAAKSGRLACVQYLVGIGSNLNAQNRRGQTAEQLALDKGHRAVFNYLREQQKTRRNA